MLKGIKTLGQKDMKKEEIDNLVILWTPLVRVSWRWDYFEALQCENSKMYTADLGEIVANSVV